MNFQDWAELRTHLIEAFNGTVPTAQAEADIINVYEHHPNALEKAALEIAAQFVSGGDIRSPWGLLHYKAGHIATAPRNPSRPSSLDREKRIERAEQRIRNVCIHYDTETEVRDELFGDRGLLHTYRGDQTLEDRMLTSWRDLRPLGELIEHEALERAEHWKQTTGKLWAARNERSPSSTPTSHSSSKSNATAAGNDSNQPTTSSSISQSTSSLESPTTAEENSSPLGVSTETPSSSPHATPERSPSSNPSASTNSATPPNELSNPTPPTPTSNECGNTSAPQPSSPSSTPSKPPTHSAAKSETAKEPTTASERSTISEKPLPASPPNPAKHHPDPIPL